MNNELLEFTYSKLLELEKKLEHYYSMLRIENEINFILNGTYILECDIENVLKGTY